MNMENEVGDTIYVPGAYVAQLYINVYGATGVVDFDNVQIAKGDSSAQISPSVPSNFFLQQL